MMERRSAQTMASLEKALVPNTAWKLLNLIPLLVLAQVILIPALGFYRVEIDFCRLRRWNFHASHLTQRPPPTFC